MDMTVPLHIEGEHHITDVVYFQADETLITIIKRAIVNKQDIQLKHQGGGELLLLSSREEYFSDIDDEQVFFSAPVSRVEIKLLKKHDPLIPEEDVIGRCTDELLWKAAFYSSQGRLLEGCNPIDRVEMIEWPNLTRLPHTPNAPRIAALLSRHVTTIALAARVLKLPPEEVYLFYSAALCAGMARPANRTQDEVTLKPHRHQTVIAALWNKIASL